MRLALEDNISFLFSAEYVLKCSRLDPDSEYAGCHRIAPDGGKRRSPGAGIGPYSDRKGRKCRARPGCITITHLVRCELITIFF